MSRSHPGRVVTFVALVAVACATAFLAAPAPARAADDCPWMSHALKPDARARMLLHAMTLTQKLGLLAGVETHTQAFRDAGITFVGLVPGQPTLCIPPLTLNDAGAGVADAQVGTTALPAPIAQAATWDTALQRRLGRTLGWEAWQKGIDVLLAPDVNIARVPENGRNFEAFGEDPFLSAQTGVAEIRGIQQNPVIATVKHFAVNSQETNRYYVSSNVGDRALHEIYLPPFEAAVREGGVGSVMCAYGLVNAVYACQDAKLLTGVLRHEFGFGGFVVSDWNATHSTAPSANAGLDLEMPSGTYFGDELGYAVAGRQVSLATIDRMAGSILTSMFRLGLFDHPPPPAAAVNAADVSTSANRQVALRVAEEGTVLLKNDHGALPLRAAPAETIAVIGAPAGAPDIRPYLSGGGSAYVAATDPVTPLQALTDRASHGKAKVVYADGSDPAAAAALAAGAQVAIVFAYDQEAEGADRPSLALPGNQDALVEAVAAANKNTIVVLQTGGPVLMPWLAQVAAVVEAWYPGQPAGDAIAAVLFGDVNPAGRLPQTFPSSDTSVPAGTPLQWPGADGAQDAAFSEGILVGYRWYDSLHVGPLFPFGFGLSYTRFAYSKLRLRRVGSSVSASFTVANTGSRTGAEVAQLYVDDPAGAHEPPRQLKGYARVRLRRGESARVTITLPPRAFAYWSTRHAWQIAPGVYRILVGGSSRDIALRSYVRLGAATAGR